MPFINPKYNMKEIHTLAEELQEKIKQATEHPHGLSGISSGFDEIDMLTSGWQKGDLIVVAGNPFMGVRAFLLSLIQPMILENNHLVTFFSPLKSNAYLIQRMLFTACEMERSKVLNSSISIEEKQQLDFYLEKFKDAMIIWDDSFPNTIQNIRDSITYLCKDKELCTDLIVIDRFDLLIDPDKRSKLEMEKALLELKGLAKEFNVPVIVSTYYPQKEFAVNDIEIMRPSFTDLFDIELFDFVDVTCFIFRPEYYKIIEDEDGNDTLGIAEIIISKNIGGTGKIRLKFNPRIGEYFPIETNTKP